MASKLFEKLSKGKQKPNTKKDEPKTKKSSKG